MSELLYYTSILIKITQILFLNTYLNIILYNYCLILKHVFKTLQ